MDDLLLISGVDIPFAAIRANVHQPRLKEIALIGEESFFAGCELLNFSKEKLKLEDRTHLEHLDDFEIFMAIMVDNDPYMQKSASNVKLLLSLIFPDYSITFESNQIILIDNQEEQHIITKQEYPELKDIVSHIFCIKNTSGNDYNPKGELAQRIADKLRQRHETLASQEGPTKISILGRYASILAVGERKDLNSLMNYTVYQLFDEFQRFTLKEENDLSLRAKMAGAKDLKEVDNWMKDIHS